ncbi:FAD-dependent oxidoreductase [bacterium]|nr:FAD-dependent oxidoreductase [bacterium]
MALSDSYLMARQKIAVVGAGAAGLTAAYLLNKHHDVHVFEKNNYLGGHANTVTLDHGPDKGMPIDTGFIVFNEQNYPVFCKLLETLKVPSVSSDMSFSFNCAESGMLYSSDVPFGLFGRLKNLFSIPFYRFVGDIMAFNRQACEDLANNEFIAGSLGDYLDRYRFGSLFRDSYVVPMGAAIWSASYADTLAMPVHAFLHFWRNHGLLQIRNRPSWRTVLGGSKNYVAAIKDTLGFSTVAADVTGIQRREDGVLLRIKGQETFHCDAVVIATHADEALALLDKPSDDEQRLLGAWSYSCNPTVFHTDQRVLPLKKRCWASWNYKRVSRDVTVPVSVSYYMNRLQSIQSSIPYIVTLNSPEKIEEKYIIKELMYTHPCFSEQALATQAELPSLNGQNRTFFCGSYFKYGFHEDAAASGAAVATCFGITL